MSRDLLVTTLVASPLLAAWSRVGAAPPTQEEVLALATRAVALRNAAEYAEAEKLCRQVLAEGSNFCAENSPEQAVILNILASVYQATGRYEQAEVLFQRSLTIDLARLGPSHPTTAQSLNNLGRLYQATKRVQLAISYFDRSRRAAQRHIVHVLPGLSEREQLDFLRRTDERNLHAALAWPWPWPGQPSRPWPASRPAGCSTPRDSRPRPAPAPCWPPASSAIRPAIDAAVTRVRQALEAAPKALQVLGEIEAEKAARAPLARLATLLLDPLRPHLDGAERWIISPDGALWLTPWAALPLDLLPRPAVPGPPTAAVIFADPEFGPASTTGAAEQRGVGKKLGLGLVPRLASTASEAIAVAAGMDRLYGRAPVVLTEEKATMAAFLALDRPRALAVATHGYLLPETDKGTDDPLLRCGLLLAGCNEPGAAGRAGILTGREVLSADLRGCELVVLSACQTGLGDVRNGEGVAGLRQAFQLAGAESVLASLWQVPDDETMYQMGAFMDALARGKDRVAALAEAQRRRIAARREKFGAAHPFNWAAFTLTGSAGNQR